VITFRPDTPVRQAAAVLTDKQITAAPVVEATGDLVGMVSEADLIADRFTHDPRSPVRRLGAEQEAPQTVGDVMTTTVVALPATADAADLAETMLTYDVRSIPILEDDRVVGIVSRRDLLRTLVRGDDVIAAEVRRRLESYTGSQSPWDVTVTVYGVVDDDAEQRVLLILARTVPGVAHADVHRRQAAHR